MIINNFASEIDEIKSRKVKDFLIEKIRDQINKEKGFEHFVKNMEKYLWKDEADYIYFEYEPLLDQDNNDIGIGILINQCEVSWYSFDENIEKEEKEHDILIVIETVEDGKIALIEY
jgi:hypothetical protein